MRETPGRDSHGPGRGVLDGEQKDAGPAVPKPSDTGIITPRWGAVHRRMAPHGECSVHGLRLRNDTLSLQGSVGPMSLGTGAQPPTGRTVSESCNSMRWSWIH